MRNSNSELSGVSLIILIWLTIVIGSIYGWVSNVVIIFNTMDAPITGKFVLRCVGIVVFPIGVVLGYL